MVIDHLELCGLGQVVLSGDGREEGPFNRSAAYNRGREQAPADVYIWHEADMIVPHDQLEDAINLAFKTDRLVVPFTRYQYLSPEETARVRARYDDIREVEPEWTIPDGKSIGAVGVCSEDAMQAIGQWDEQFAGWGFDDNAMYQAFKIACGPATLVDGDAWHLYHVPGWSKSFWKTEHTTDLPAEEVLATARNRTRCSWYVEATDPDQIRALTAGLAL